MVRIEVKTDKENCIVLLSRLTLILPIMGIMCLLPFVGQSQNEKHHNKSSVLSENYSVLHPRFRKWASPAMNTKVINNPPVLYWPRVSGKDVTYDLRLAQNIRYDGYPIRVNDIPWTFYNPHRVLTPGTWYWQYRVNDGRWSNVFQFQIPSDARKLTSPPVCNFLSSIPDTHPRLLIEQNRIKMLRSYAKESADAKMIIREADIFLCSPFPAGNLIDINYSIKSYDSIKDPFLRKQIQTESKALGFHSLSAIRILCEAFILTHDQKYIDKGIAWAMQVAGWDTNGGSGISDFGDAACMLAMALAFDTFNGQLTSSQKHLLLKRISIRANRFYYDWINKIDAKLLSNHVWQYILNYFFQTAVAVHGDLKDADKWLTYAYELWMARSPILGGENGGWANGIPYFKINLETLLEIPMIIKDFTGYDFINATRWYRRNTYWLYYSFPPGSSCTGFGDNAETMRAPGAGFLAYADALSRITGSRMAATYAAKIEKIENITPTDADMFRWFRLHYLTDKKRPKPLPDDSLPSAMLFPDVGVVDIHSDINHIDEDLMIAMRSSPYGSYSHMLADQNTFNLMYGGQRLFYISGEKDYMKSPERLGWYKATIGHNGILIDQKGQGFGSESYGWIPRFLNGKSITYAVGDASNAYSGKNKKEPKGLEYFRRHILFLRPDIVVIYDVLKADHRAAWSWLIHSQRRIYLDQSKNKFSCSLDKVSASVRFLSSKNVRWKLTDTLGIPTSDWKKMQIENPGWNLTAETTRKSKKIRFLAIIKIDPKGNSKKKEVTPHFSNKEIAIGNWVINAEMDISKRGRIRVNSKDGKVLFTSSGDLKNKSLNDGVHASLGSAKLAEYINGEWVLQYAKDVFPSVVRTIPINLKISAK